MNFLGKLEEQGKVVNISLAFALIGAIGFFDFLTGYELSFSVFYVIPISLVTAVSDWRAGLVASVVSAVVWVSADLASGHTYSHSFIPVWNSLIRLCFFIIITFLLSALKRSMEHEKELARTDTLTGAVNSRFFRVLTQMEIDRLERYQHPFTLAYIDLDNFKALNDQSGHLTGDKALRATVSFIRSHMRRTDVIARLGGDEFALLLPETNEELARIAVSKIQNGLLEEMQRNNWPITLSIGVLTCRVPPPSTDVLIKMADELMYSVKRQRKNGINYSTFAG